MSLEMNRNAFKILEEIIEQPNRYGVKIEEAGLGATLIDAGLEAQGGLLTGEKITEICLGGLGEASISMSIQEDFGLPYISVYTDHPAISTLGAQLAGWHIRVSDYEAIGSGPARALALKPKRIFERIGYSEKSDVAVLVLEAERRPPTEVIEMIAGLCDVDPKNLFLILVPTGSIAGLTQISGRIVETGVYRLLELGVDPMRIAAAWGSAPIMLPHPDIIEAMGRGNDAVLYGGIFGCTLNWEDEGVLQSLVSRTVFSSSKYYGRLFREIFKEADFNFQKIDPEAFAPAKTLIHNIKTGRIYSAGETSKEMLMKSLDFNPVPSPKHG
ncbi:MAG: methenyltetrahydromethanopterin cyclohydrolase [Nitrososphaerota archaeon]|nr:methenyltetrahydromethanopterin cyclohydrolase [Candidatus Bathyarchaeota archaeon]MDW8048759.1 methenyltetrahydromethanopterin cyclohydrolase [Nitrososphaerota archaeon]